MNQLRVVLYAYLQQDSNDGRKNLTLIKAISEYEHFKAFFSHNGYYYVYFNLPGEKEIEQFLADLNFYLISQLGAQNVTLIAQSFVKDVDNSQILDFTRDNFYR